MKLVECVPNFSEGRDEKVIKAIASAIESVEGVKLLDVDPGWDTNRTVYTFVGAPEAVVEAAFQGIKVAAELIDMRKHSGAHPRMGAADVVPFVPVSGVTMEECVELAKKLGKRVWEELKIPVYLYEYAATADYRRNLADIRAGEYEGLEAKLKDPKWAPDFGDPVFNPKSGATVVGARDFLIAYNINLNTKDKKLANKIAKRIRESGYYKKNEAGERVHVPGRFSHCKAIGWYVDDYGIAQISINLTNYKVTPPHAVFDAVVEEAAELGLRVTGSEIVGLVPKEALLMAADHYLRKQKRSTAMPERDKIFIAVRSLGLSDVTEFDPDKKVIEYAIEERKGFKWMGVGEFCDLLSSDAPAPGGGTVAALDLAKGAALVAMVANLTAGRKKFADVYDEVCEVGEEAQKLKEDFLRAADEDTESFNRYMAARKMPKSTPEEVEAREKAMKEALIHTIEVPLSVLKKGKRVLELAKRIVEIGNPNSVSDAGCAAVNALAGCENAYLNVCINASSLEEEERKRFLEEADAVLKECRKLKDEIYDLVLAKIWG